MHSRVQRAGTGVAVYIPVDAQRWADLEEGTEIAIVLEESKKYGKYIGIGKKKA